MARPTKLTEFKRFSLRVPTYLFRALKHEAVELDISLNDALNEMALDVELIRKAGRRRTDIHEDGTWRYSWRASTSAILSARHDAKIMEMSINSWMIQLIAVKVREAPWLRLPKVRRAA